MKNFRNKKLLQLAKQSPVCFGCNQTNDGTVVACHSNQIRDGKGTGIKAHDYRIAYMCYKCHNKETDKNLTRQERQQFWEDAHRSTIGWLFDSGHLVVK